MIRHPVFFPPILLLLDSKIHLWKAIPRLYHIFLKSLKRSSQMPPIFPETKSRLGTYFQKSEPVLCHHSAGRILLKGLNMELADCQAHIRARENKTGNTTEQGAAPPYERSIDSSDSNSELVSNTPESMAKNLLKSTSLNKRGGHPLLPQATSSSSERSRERAERNRSNHRHNAYRQNHRPPSRSRDRGRRRSRSLNIERRTHKHQHSHTQHHQHSLNQPATSLSALPAHRLRPAQLNRLHNEWRRRLCLPSPSHLLSCKPKPLRTLSPPRRYRFQPPRPAPPARFHR